MSVPPARRRPPAGDIIRQGVILPYQHRRPIVLYSARFGYAVMSSIKCGECGELTPVGRAEYSGDRGVFLCSPCASAIRRWGKR